jgi:hypothetical protein
MLLMGLAGSPSQCSVAPLCAATVNMGFATRDYYDFVNAASAVCLSSQNAWLLPSVEGAGERLVRPHTGTLGEESADELAVVDGQCTFAVGVAR